MTAFSPASADMLMTALVGLPILTALACLLRQSPLFSGTVSILSSALQLTCIAVIAYALLTPETNLLPRYPLGGWGAPLGIDLAINGYSAVMLLTVAAINVILCLYSVFYFRDIEITLRFWPLWWFLVAGLNALFLSADAFNLYVTLEMIGLASVALIGLSGTRDALVAALRYALVGLLGSLCYLFGIALLYRTYGTLDLVEMSKLVVDSPLSSASLILISVGLLLKTALFPMHFWLPQAHGGAPAPISAMLSALVVKASFYLLVRFWFDVLDVSTSTAALYFIGLLGCTAILWGCIAALKAERLKLLVAYSTVAQIGYLFLVFPVMASTQNAKVALEAVLYFVVAHAFAKSAMFLAAGNIQKFLGHDNIDHMHGLVTMKPFAVTTFAIAGFSLIGLPPSGGFIAKWLMLNAAIDSGAWPLVLVMLIGGLLAALYVCKFLNIAFAQGNNVSAVQAGKDVPHVLTVSALMLALGTILLGFYAEWLIDLMRIGLFQYPGEGF